MISGGLRLRKFSWVWIPKEKLHAHLGPYFVLQGVTEGLQTNKLQSAPEPAGQKGVIPFHSSPTIDRYV